MAFAIRAKDMVEGDSAVAIVWPLTVACSGTGFDIVATGG